MSGPRLVVEDRRYARWVVAALGGVAAVLLWFMDGGRTPALVVSAATVGLVVMLGALPRATLELTEEGITRTWLGRRRQWRWAQTASYEYHFVAVEVMPMPAELADVEPLFPIRTPDVDDATEVEKAAFITKQAMPRFLYSMVRTIRAIRHHHPDAPWERVLATAFAGRVAHGFGAKMPAARIAKAD